MQKRRTGPEKSKALRFGFAILVGLIIFLAVAGWPSAKASQFTSTEKHLVFARILRSFNIPTPTSIPIPVRSPAPPTLLLNPLSGLPVADPGILQQQPLAVQIDNAPPARPQNGLSQAQLVYETPTEAGFTRYTAFFLGGPDLDKIGNIRSARLVDLEIIPEYQAVLTHAGGSTEVQNLLYKNLVPQIDLLLLANYKNSWRSTDREPPYNLYSNTALLRRAQKESGLVWPLKWSGLYFRSLEQMPFPSIKAAAAATSIDIPYVPSSEVTYQYDSATRLYLRSVAGSPAIDASTGLQVAPRNIIVQFAPELVTSIVEDVLGAKSREFILTGSGPAVIFRDGEAIPVHWKRRNSHEVTHYFDDAGHQIGLAPGQTWVEIVAAGSSITYKSTIGATAGTPITFAPSTLTPTPSSTATPLPDISNINTPGPAGPAIPQAVSQNTPVAIPILERNSPGYRK